MSDMPSVALVTGGSRGIGKACALRLAQDGYEVWLTYVSRPEEAAKVCEEIAAAGGKAQAFRLDSSDREAVAAFFKDTVKPAARLDVLVNNAGITKDGLLIRMKDEDWDRVIAVNLSGAFAVLREAAKLMAKQRGGRIVNISSVVGQCGNVGQASYAAAKAGIVGVTKTAALELAGRGVTVNAVAPGFIATDMTATLSEEIQTALAGKIPLGRMGSAQDIAAAVSFLASPGAAYITGQVLAVNGGMYM